MILSAGIPELQDPVLTARLVEGGEPDVRRVAVHPRGQQVGVRVSDPGHRQVAEILHGAGDVGGFSFDADDSFGWTLDKVGPRERPSRVGSDVIIELSQVIAGPPGRVS